jgi:hypothetical protein
MTTIDDKFWHLKGLLHDLYVTATLVKDVDAVEKILPAGTRVRIVMMSSFGDVGITDKLDEMAYCARVGGEPLADGMNPRNPGNLDDLFTDITGMTGKFIVTEYFKSEELNKREFSTTLEATNYMDDVYAYPAVDYKTHFTMLEEVVAKTIAVDYLGEELSVGDLVVFYQKGYRNFAKGTIIKLSAQMLRIQPEHTTDAYSQLRQFHNQVIRII